MTSAGTTEIGEGTPTSERTSFGGMSSREGASADLLDSVLVHAPVVVWEIDTEGVFTLSTGQGLEVLGLQPGEAVGESAFELYGDHPTIVNDIRRALDGEEFRTSVELDGTYFDSWYSPRYDGQDKIVGVRGVATIITPQKRAEQELRIAKKALKESKDRFAKAFHSSPLGIIFSRPQDGTFIDVNDAFVRISGYSREELLGPDARPFESWKNPADREKFVRTIQEQGCIRDAEFEFTSKQGQTMVGRVSAEMIELDGEFCILSLCEDVTEQRMAEEAARESRRRYQTLAQLAPVGIFHADANGECIFINEQYSSVSGQTLAEASGTGWTDAIHPDDRDEVFLAWSAAAESGTPYRREMRLQRPDGETTWILVQAVPERDDSGVVTSFVGTITPIDDLKQIEHAQRELNLELSSRIRERTDELNRTDSTLKEQIRKRELLFEELVYTEAQWKSVAEDAPDFILIVNREREITYINKTAPPLKKSDVEGKDVFLFIPEGFHEQVRDDLARLFDTGELQNSEVMARGPHDQPAWYSSRMAPVKVGGEIVAASIVARDITEQKSLEEEMNRRQAQLAHVARLNTMGELAGTLAHELNQPLSAISNYAAGCARRLRSGPVNVEELVKAAEKIGDQADRASETIRRILDFVRKNDVLYEKVCLGDLVENVVEMAMPAADRQKIRIHTDVDKGLPLILADRVQIEQVLLNLVVNAIEVLRESSIGSGRVKISASLHSKEQVRIAVTDNGHGLPDDFADWIFEPFESGKTGGIGLGLSISRSIIKSHKGRLWATSNDGEGAAFYVSLPVAPGDATHD